MPDAIWDLTKDEQDRRYLSARGRDVDQPKALLEFDPETKALTLDDAEPEAPKLKQASGKSEAKILAHFGQDPTPLSKNKIFDAVGGGRNAVFAAVDALVVAGHLAAGADGKYALTALPGL
ncbi:hypothetical protein [Streptomyces swartbergensis]|uniref:hypothetical protein n=1 Tax=Streptomyces swartbergensis TaxID=487165 RepID=UPI003817D1B8